MLNLFYNGCNLHFIASSQKKLTVLKKYDKLVLKWGGSMEIAQYLYKQKDGGYSDEPLKVNNAGYYKDAGNVMHIDNEYYDDYLIIYNLHGAVEVWHGYDCRKLSDGDITIIPPHVRHKFSYFRRENSEYYWCHFSGALATELVEKIIASHSTNFHIGCYMNIAQLFIKIYESLLNNSEDVTNNLLYTLLFSVGALAENPLKADLDENVSDILKSVIYIQNNYNKEISVESLSEMCHLSKYNFMRKFKTITGSPVHKFITDYRMMQAKRLLSTTELNVKEVALHIGFVDNMYFSRAFKKHFGISPTEYKDKAIK